MKVLKYGISLREIDQNDSQIDRNIQDDPRSASAMCTPAIAEGLSNNTSASLHCSQESTSTTENRFDQIKKSVVRLVTYSRRAKNGTGTKIRKEDFSQGDIRTLDKLSLKNWGENIYASE